MLYFLDVGSKFGKINPLDMAATVMAQLILYTIIILFRETEQLEFLVFNSAVNMYLHALVNTHSHVSKYTVLFFNLQVKN